MASVVGANGPGTCGTQAQYSGSLAPQHVESSQARDRVCVLCLGRQISSHQPTAEAPGCSLSQQWDPRLWGCRSGPGGWHPCAPPSAFTSYSVSSQKDQHEHLGQIVLGPWCPRAGPMEISGMGCWVRAGLPWGNVLPRLGYTCGVFYHINDKRLQTAVQLWAASVRTELVSGREEEPLASPHPWRCDLGRPLPRKWDVWVKITGRN